MGSARPESDVDLLLVMPDNTDCRKMMVAASLHLPIDRTVDVDLLVATPSVLERHRGNAGLVYRQILRTGRVVYDAPSP
jgi:predicted nucleotidyltransferase